MALALLLKVEIKRRVARCEPPSACQREFG